MIRINLLPEEMRRSSGSSPRALGVLFVASLLGFGGLGVTGYLWFNVRADKQARVDIAQDQLDNLTPRANYSDALTKEKSEFEKRNKTIGEIAASRIVWTRKLDRLSEIVNRDVTQQRHRVWIESLRVDNRAETQQGGVEVKGLSAGADIEGVSNFHEDLRNDPVFGEGFVSHGLPSSKLGDSDDDFEPAAKREFGFELKLPSRDAKKQPAPKKPAKPAGS
jgi:Tfp pilus assembly protein PilN